jgi:hypothetical protein
MVCPCYNDVLSLMVLNKSAIDGLFRCGQWPTAQDVWEVA